MTTMNVDFRAEELEPRTEMQMLGVAADPGIVVFYSDGSVEIWIILFEDGSVLI